VGLSASGVHAPLLMETQTTESGHPRRGTQSWLDALRLHAMAFEDWIDRMALRLGDVLLGAKWSEKLFGPHPAHR
jgi:hypothetical protein